MIRVLHVVTSMNRNGLENRIMDIYRHIDRTQIQFDFLTHRKEKGAFDDEIRQLGGEVYYFSPLNPLHIFSYMNQLFTFFKEHREYKIVHSHINAFSTWVLLAAKKSGVPVRIAHSRIWGIEKSWKMIFKHLSRSLIGTVTTHRFGCSRQAGEWLFGKKGIEPPYFFRVITNSIEIEKFAYHPETRAEMRKKLGLEDDQLALIDVARLEPQKNQMFLLKVFREILKNHQNARLFLVGEGGQKEELLNSAKTMGINESVVFVGSISNVGEYLNAMDAFVFPSLFEGFGTVTVESQCCGLPILASDTIPHETKISEFQEFESLHSSPEVWADHVLQMIARLKRRDMSKATIDAGYDIRDTYSYLENFYLGVIDSQK